MFIKLKLNVELLICRARAKSPVIDLAAPDISIVKIEASSMKDETGGLDMYVDTHDDGGAHPSGIDDLGEQYDGSDYDVEEPPGEMEGSNDGSNLSGDQNSWFLSNVKGRLMHRILFTVYLGTFSVNFVAGMVTRFGQIKALDIEKEDLIAFMFTSPKI